MPKRCGCGDTCACVINGGPGIDVDGSGTVDHPYTISNAADALAETIIFDNSGNVDFVTLGAGTAADPMHVAAGASLNLADLLDVADTPAPANGQALVWNGTAWAPGTVASGGGGAGADEVVIAATAPTPVNNLPELWLDTSASAAVDTDTGWVIGGSGNTVMVVNATNFTLTSSWARMKNGRVQIGILGTMNVVSNNPADGNIGNITIGTLAAQWIPKSPWDGGLNSIGAGRVVIGFVATNTGSVQVAAIGGTTALAVGEQISLVGTYLID